MQLGLGLSLPLVGKWGGANYVFVNAEAAALVARFTTPPTEGRKPLIDNLVGALKAAGAWALRDWYHFIGADAQATNLNWKSTSYTLLPVNSPAFVADRYYQGDGSSAYLDTRAVRNALTNYQQDSANLAVWSGLGAGSSSAALLGGNIATARILPRSGGGNASIRINDGTALNLAVATPEGWTSANRSGASARQTYKDGAQLTSDATASAALTASTFYYMQDVGTYCALPWLAGAGGGSLTLAQHTAERAAIYTYLQSIGAVA